MFCTIINLLDLAYENKHYDIASLILSKLINLKLSGFNKTKKIKLVDK